MFSRKKETGTSGERNFKVDPNADLDDLTNETSIIGPLSTVYPTYAFIEICDDTSIIRSVIEKLTNTDLIVFNYEEDDTSVIKSFTFNQNGNLKKIQKLCKLANEFKENTIGSTRLEIDFVGYLLAVQNEVFR